MIAFLAVAVPILGLVALLALFALHKIAGKPDWYDEEE